MEPKAIVSCWERDRILGVWPLISGLQWKTTSKDVWVAQIGLEGLKEKKNTHKVGSLGKVG